MYRHRLRQTATNHVRDSTLLSVPSKSSVKYRGRCPRCPNRSAGKERASLHCHPPHRLVRNGTGGVQRVHVKVSTLREISGRAIYEVRMVVPYENRAYRFLCKPCARVYVRKRRELNGPTEFGHKVGLKASAKPCVRLHRAVEPPGQP